VPAFTRVYFAGTASRVPREDTQQRSW